jgi:hypothetical protein
MIDYCTITAQSHDKYILSDINTEIKKPRHFMVETFLFLYRDYLRRLPFNDNVRTICTWD